MIRNTHTEKWEDRWFSELSPEAMLVFFYLCDKVNNAGFLEYTPKKIANETGIPIEKIKNSVIPELIAEKPGEDEPKRSVILHKDWFFLPNFLRHQRNRPVNPRNRAHGPIIALIINQAIRFFTVIEYKELKAELDAALAASESGSAELPFASRDDLKRAPKDWTSVRDRCFAALNPLFRHDDALRRRFEEWWDHRMVMGEPLELPMWNELQSQCMAFAGSPAVIMEAIGYSIANGMKTLNFMMAKKALEEKGQNPAPAATKKEALAEPEGWTEAFLAAFADAEVPSSFWRVAKSSRKALYAHDPGLEARVNLIEKK